MQTTTTDVTRLLRRGEVEARTGLSRSSIYSMMGEGHFPRPVRLSPDTGGVRWVDREIEAWIAQRIAARTPQP